MCGSLAVGFNQLVTKTNQEKDDVALTHEYETPSVSEVEIIQQYITTNTLKQVCAIL